MGCSKNGYRNFKEAKAAAKAIMARDGYYAQPYKCDHCDEYHITTRVKNRLKRPAKKLKYPMKDVVKRRKEEMPEPKINIGYRPEKTMLHTEKIGTPLKNKK
jgi:hypothetical protein